MNWDDYRHFLAVARTERLTSAAQALGVDHATVGRRIKTLEKAIGANLFDKSPQGYRLTEAGQMLMPHAVDIERSVLSIATHIGSIQNELTGVVRIGVPEGLATYVLADAATQLCRQYPMLELQIVALPRKFSLAKREADFVIAVSPPQSGRLKFRKIADYKLHLYATQTYLDQHPPILSVEDLQKVRGIAYVSDLIYDKELDYIPLVSPDIKPHLTSTSIHFQLSATLADGGLCIMHDFMAQQHPQLVKVLPDIVSFTRSFWFVVHEDYANLEHIRTCAEAIIAQMRKKLLNADYSQAKMSEKG